MAENNQLTERRAKISLVTDLHYMHADSMESAPLQRHDEPSAHRKKKKKKKKPKASQIVDQNASEFLQSDKGNVSMKECNEKSEQCSITVGVNTHDLDSAGRTEISSQDSDEHYGGKIPSLESNSPKSALRGGYEQLGFGPRPKLHVKWAPSVWEPPSSIVSHTVNDNKPKKLYSKRSLKHGHKGKASYEHKKKEKRKPEQTKIRNHMKDDTETQDVSPPVADEILFWSNLESKPAIYKDGEARENEAVDMMSGHDLDIVKCGKSTYAVSLIGSHFPCNLVYEQAM